MSKNIEMNYFNGSAYEKMVPSTVAGDNSCFLTTETAALYGLDENAVPDDIFEYIYGLFPSNTSTIRIYVEDQYSRPLNAKVTISPTIDNKSVFYTLSNGRLTLSVPEGAYTITLANSIFYTCTENTKSITVVNGTPNQVNFIVNSIASGKEYLRSSGEMCVPPWIKPDLFAVGGGGGGGSASYNTRGSAASGGAGGEAKTILHANVNGKNLKYTIGSRGEGYSGASDKGGAGGNGGSTTVTYLNDTILVASGGRGGNGTNATSVAGASGGSGSGGVGSGNIGDAGSDGSNGGGPNGGSGQGFTTREFGEPDGELYCGAGGGAICGRAAKGGGAGGGGNGAQSGGVYVEGWKAGSGTKYGAGGGACGAMSASFNGSAGDGYQGVLIVRWNEEGAV